MLSRSEPEGEIEIATNKITTMFLYFGKSEPQRSYKHGSYKKKKVYLIENDQKKIESESFFNFLSRVE